MDEEKKEIETELLVTEPQQVPDLALPQPVSSKMQAFTIPLSIIVAGALVGGAIIYSNSHRPPSQQNLAGAGAAVPAQPELKEVTDTKALEGNAEVMGNPNAPVTLVEFADYQCPFCERFYTTAAPKIFDMYVKTGKAKFIFRDFAFLGPESAAAGQAAECARDQSKFWQYHNYLFEHQNGENQGGFAKDKLKGFAKAVGLNTKDFDACLDTGKHAQDVEKDTQAGRNFGVSGTPTVFVNGKPIVGAQPFEVFKTAIDAVLAGK